MNNIPAIPSYELHMTSRFVDPTFIAKVRGGGNDAVVQADGSIYFYGERLIFADSNVAMEPGTEVEVYLFRKFTCSTVADIQARLEHLKAAEEKERELERIRRNAHRDESIAFNASLQIPVKWNVGVKDVLSGLSANSCGDGRNSATVEHVFLKEDLHVGRLTRKAGDFLCCNSKSRGGAAWRETDETWSDGDGATYQPKVTCKACLVIAERLKKTAVKKGN